MAQHTEIAESYRSLRSTVKFATGDRPIHSVLVVDVDRDTRSQVAEQLAAAFAEAGDRCVLVDTDSRRRDDSSTGFFDLLHGSAGAESVAEPAANGNLSYIGPGQGGSPDLLAGDQFQTALAELVEKYEFAILSSAPLPKYADALAMSSRVDAAILVITSGDTRRPDAIEARDALERVGARILGVVMLEPKRRRFW